AQEALLALGTVDGARMRHLQRHFAIELRVIGPVDRAKSPGAEPGANLKSPDLLAGIQSQGRWWRRMAPRSGRRTDALCHGIVRRSRPGDQGAACSDGHRHQELNAA